MIHLFNICFKDSSNFKSQDRKNFAQKGRIELQLATSIMIKWTCFRRHVSFQVLYMFENQEEWRPKCSVCSLFCHCQIWMFFAPITLCYSNSLAMLKPLLSVWYLLICTNLDQQLIQRNYLKYLGQTKHNYILKKI